MSMAKLWPVLLALALTACGGGNADALAQQGQKEAAAMQGKPAASAVIDPAHAACDRAGGDWKAGPGQCAINASMCASTAGSWIQGTGCAVDAADEAACMALAGNGGLDGFKGIQWKQGGCVLAYLAGDELASQGF